MSNSIIQDIQQIEDALLPEIDNLTIRNQYAWWLLEKITNQSKAHLILHKENRLSLEQKHQLRQWIAEMVHDHKPIAYILGTMPFGPLSIKVKPPILIPRPETEEWALDLINKIKKCKAHTLTILDLCTGSGCIALLFAALLPDAHIYAVDINSDALTLTQENMKLSKITNLTIAQSDLFAQLPHLKFDLIVSNPPYISAVEYQELAPSVALWEDKNALYADDQGLKIIKKIIDQAPLWIKSNNILQKCGINQLYIEIGWQQADLVTKLMQKKGYLAITTHKDSAQKDRVVSGRISNVATATV